MDNIEEEGIKKFNELRQKAAQRAQVKTVPTFSINAISNFASGFDILIFGYLSFLKKNTLHKSIQCNVSCQQIYDHTITDSNSYNTFASDLNNITPPVRVDFTFTLTNGAIGLNDISETLSVNFSANEYEIVYNEKIYRIQYMNDLESGDTTELQNLIWNSILDKTALELD